MYPVLVEIGGFSIHSFGLLMALAWLAAGIYLDRNGRPAGLDGDRVSGFLLWTLIGSILGARALYLAVEYPSWTSHPWEAVFSRSGFVFYGGLFGGVLAGVLFVRRHGLAVLPVADVIAPALALGLGIGRIGCFLAGDDYGRPTDLPWAVTFDHPHTLAPMGVALHPAQLYLSLNGFCIFAILHRRFSRLKFAGETAGLFLMLYPLTRFLLEFTRGDPRGFYGPLSTSQWISLLVFPAGVLLYLRREKDSGGRGRRGPGGVPGADRAGPPP
ncbi:prolipoprotein diacylglyceryl transferase [bacterium]|nr:prolipoprotein diacylglyceryl transferase [bacterium]